MNNTDDKQVLIPSVREMSSWGPDDPKINKPHAFAKIMVKHLELDEKTLDEVDFLADRLMDKLESSLMYYQLIMANDFDARNISQKRTIYEGLYANLWSFYKGRVQNFLTKMGWSLGIFFCKENNFKKEAKKFAELFPEHTDLIEMARKQRAAWQSDFANSRNKSEHSGDYRDGTNTYENKDDAKRLFAQVCWTAESLIAYCGSYKMDKNWNVVELIDGVTIFDEQDIYIIEHAMATTLRERAESEN